MKTIIMSITAIAGTLVAIPLLLGRRKPQVVTVATKPSYLPNEHEMDLRYDVDDFLTE